MKKIKTLANLFWVFFRIGFMTFGGGYVMISLIHSLIVEKRQWISDEEMLDIIAIAESTPGPIAVNTATFVGYKRAGILGGILATLAIALPSLIVISVIAYFYEDIISVEIIRNAFKGIICAISALIFVSAMKLFKGNLKTSKLPISLVLMIAAMVVILLTDFSSIYLILIGGFLGFIIYTFFIKEKKEVSEWFISSSFGLS